MIHCTHPGQAQQPPKLALKRYIRKFVSRRNSLISENRISSNSEGQRSETYPRWRLRELAPASFRQFVPQDVVRLRDGVGTLGSVAHLILASGKQSFLAKIDAIDLILRDSIAGIIVYESDKELS